MTAVTSSVFGDPLEVWQVTPFWRVSRIGDPCTTDWESGKNGCCNGAGEMHLTCLEVRLPLHLISAFCLYSRRTYFVVKRVLFRRIYESIYQSFEYL